MPGDIHYMVSMPEMLVTIVLLSEMRLVYKKMNQINGLLVKRENFGHGRPERQALEKKKGSEKEKKLERE